jgi:hypothetical protein
MLTIGGVEIVQSPRSESVGNGVCNLKNGFHRVEFWLVSSVRSGGGWDSSYHPEMDRPGGDYFKDTSFNWARFDVKILTPNALDAMPLTKDMMLLKAEQKKASGVGQGEKAKGKSIPYIDY